MNRQVSDKFGKNSEEAENIKLTNYEIQCQIMHVNNSQVSIQFIQSNKKQQIESTLHIYLK